MFQTSYVPRHGVLFCTLLMRCHPFISSAATSSFSLMVQASRAPLR